MLKVLNLVAFGSGLNTVRLDAFCIYLPRRYR